MSIKVARLNEKIKDLINANSCSKILTKDEISYIKSKYQRIEIDFESHIEKAKHN